MLLRGAMQAEIAVPAVVGAIDTTGAGDAFAGGFLLAHRARRAAGRRGAWPAARAAACVVRGLGADGWVTA